MRPGWLARARGGITLMVVLVMLLLCSLLAWLAAGQAGLSEALLGHEVEDALAVAAAQALLRDAEREVLGQRVDGSPCLTPAGVPSCRDPAEGPVFPADGPAFAVLSARLLARHPPCEQGICLGLGEQVGGDAASFWRQAQWRQTWVDAGGGVPYGRYTGAQSQPLAAASADGGTGAADDLLQITSQRGAWYWVEVLPYQVGQAAWQAGTAAVAARTPLTPLPAHPYVYRVTAVVQGRFPPALVVLQTLLVRQALGGV